MQLTVAATCSKFVYQPCHGSVCSRATEPSVQLPGVCVPHRYMQLAALVPATCCQHAPVQQRPQWTKWQQQKKFQLGPLCMLSLMGCLPQQEWSSHHKYTTGHHRSPSMHTQGNLKSQQSSNFSNTNTRSGINRQCITKLSSHLVVLHATWAGGAARPQPWNVRRVEPLTRHVIATTPRAHTLRTQPLHGSRALAGGSASACTGARWGAAAAQHAPRVCRRRSHARRLPSAPPVSSSGTADPCRGRELQVVLIAVLPLPAALLPLPPPPLAIASSAGGQRRSSSCASVTQPWWPHATRAALPIGPALTPVGQQ